MDTVDRATRRRIMQAVRSRDTKPELFVRQQVFAAGFRYRLCDKRLPGRPDLVLPRYRTAVFVHGCFWHRHGCARSTTPATNVEFWRAKLDRNQARDRAATKELRRRGYKVEILWECELERGVARLLRRLARRRAALAAGAR